MTDQSPWGQSPPPAPRRFHPGSIWSGIALGIAVTVGGTMLAAGAAVPLTPLLVAVCLLAALIVGGVLAVISGPPKRRGLGLGLVIGWGASVLIGGGMCVYLLTTWQP